MRENIKISVIIPVYNVEKYLNECVDSVLNQTYRNIEVILVDDGSPDNTPDICDEYSKNDKRVNVIHKINGGLSSARNAGIDVMTGDYFIFLDSDDYWNDTKFLECIVKEKLVNRPDLLIFGYTTDKDLINTYERNFEIEKTLSSNNKEKCLKELISNDRLQSTACNKFVNSSLVKEHSITFQTGIYSEDIDWTAKLIILSKTISYYDDYVYFYRKNETSITHNLKRKNIMDLKNQIIRIVELSKQIEQEDYYEWYMNYCAYQYITFLNCVVTIDKSENISEFVNEMKEYAYLLNYHVNKKVNLVYKFYKLLGYKGMLKILKLFLKIRG